MKKMRIEFYKDAQAAIETEYLEHLPRFDGRHYRLRPKKENRKDGYIERPIHGGMHVGRASLWVVVLHQLFKENFPGYVSGALECIKQQFDLDEKELVDTTRMAAIYHDSARLDEGQDFWDKQSAQKLVRFLDGTGANSDMAEFFEQAAGNKDKADAFEAHLKKAGMPQFAHYIRLLINLADCIDIIRCVSHFEFNQVLKRLAVVPEYKVDTQKYQPAFLELVLNAHRVIYLQGDMRYPCRIIMPDGSTAKTDFEGDHLIMARKVLFEHAPNVVSALAADMMTTTPYFKRFFQNEPLLCTELASVEPMFDPFLHGTQSSMLIMLERSSYELDSLTGLLGRGLTSLTGELYAGTGHNTTLNSSPLMCFGKLHQWRGYDLKRIIDSYTKGEPTQSRPEVHRQNALMKFREFLEKSRNNSYATINSVLIYYMRAKFFGVSDEELIAPDAFYAEYKAGVDTYYLLLLVAEYFEVNPDFKNHKDISQWVQDHYQFKHFVQRILASRLDLRAIYQNPSPENLAKCLPLFPVPDCDDPAISMVKVLENRRDCSRFEREYDFFKVTLQNEYSTRILYFFVGWRLYNPFTSYEPAKEHLVVMEQHLEMLRKLTQTKPDNIFENPQKCDLLTRNFPLILISDNAEVMTILNSDYCKEYRAKRPIKFGIDIQMVATDTREHALILRKWLDQHNFKHVTVVLFHELQNVKDTSRRPKALYQHADGFPRLSWFAAAKVTAEDKAKLEALRDHGQRELDQLSESQTASSETIIKKSEDVSALYDAVLLIEDANRYELK